MKQPWHEGDHFSRSSAEDKNNWSGTSAPVCVYSHGFDKDNYTFTFTVVQFGTNPVCKVTQGTKFCMVVPNIRWSSLHNCHSYGIWNFEVAPRYLENLRTPTSMTEEYCVVDMYWHLEKTCCLHIN